MPWCSVVKGGVAVPRLILNSPSGLGSPLSEEVRLYGAKAGTGIDAGVGIIPLTSYISGEVHKAG